MISSELEYGLHGAKVASRRDPLLVGGAIEVQQKIHIRKYNCVVQCFGRCPHISCSHRTITAQ